jgi:hypothetical protein
MKETWRGKGKDGICELQRRLHVLFHFVNFSLKRRLMYEPPGAWPLIPPGHQNARITVYPAQPEVEKGSLFKLMGKP